MQLLKNKINSNKTDNIPEMLQQQQQNKSTL